MRKHWTGGGFGGDTTWGMVGEQLQASGTCVI